MDSRTFVGGMALGAALALVLDPNGRARRWALIRDIVREAQHTLQGRLWSEDVTDSRLVERVRAKLRRVCSHPHAIGVEVCDGEVTLRGPILADEVRDVLEAAASARGVHAVVNNLEPHERANGVPSLQGIGRRPGRRLHLQQNTWTPATRALAGVAALAAGGLALSYSRR